MSVDVCFVLEDTYPFVAGDVSSWIHGLIQGMPDLSFHVVHVSPRPGAYHEGALYDLPDNVAGVDEVFLAGPPHGGAPPLGEDAVRALFDQVRALARDPHELAALVATADGFAHVDPTRLCASRGSWSKLVEIYDRHAADESFLDFFRTWTDVHRPLLSVLRARLPDARVYHAACTGYAGLLAAVAKARTGRPMLLTEPGIELGRAGGLPERDTDDLLARREPAFCERFRTEHLETLARVAHAGADAILTPCDGRGDRQAPEGTGVPDAARTVVVPNGIDVARYAAAASALAQRVESSDPGPLTVGFVGRIAPVKDVLTLVRAARVVADELDDVVFEILSPDADDEEYAQECRDLTAALDLDDVVRFRGRVKVEEWLPRLDLMVLTSVSEARPLVVLEAGAVGLPVVATDVGSCRELLLGRGTDRGLGAGGVLTPIATPGVTAEAILRLARDASLRHRMGRTLFERVQRSYVGGTTTTAHRDIYERWRGAA